MKDSEIITVANEKGIRIIQVESLLGVKVEDYVCTFYIENGEFFSCTHSMKDVEKLLPEHFCRISRNTVVNIKKIKTIELRQREVVLTSGNAFSYSRRNAKLIRDKLSNNGSNGSV